MVNFLDFEGTDPSSAAQEAAEAITAARRDAEAKGIKSFLFAASSTEEFDQRTQFGEVPEIVAEIADLYLGSPDESAQLTAALRREFVAKGCGDCPGGTKCVCDEDGCRCVKTSTKTAEKIAGQHCPTCAQAWGVCVHTNGEATKHTDPVDHTAPKKTAQAYDDDESDARPNEPKAFAICPTCDGRGKHVNPSIDSNGLPDDFASDPDFMEDYMGGAYDVHCAECGGKRVVPQCSADGCNEPAEQRMQASYSRDRRDRSTGEHESTCYQHLPEDEKEDRQSYYDSIAENEAELRMGA